VPDDAAADDELVCGDAPGETPMLQCAEIDLQRRDQVVQTAIDTLVGRGLSRPALDSGVASWRSATLAKCGPRPDSVTPPPDSVRAAWSCWSGAFNEHVAVLRDLRPR
jgi:hypothetical protein